MNLSLSPKSNNSFYALIITSWHLDNLIAYIRRNNLAPGSLFVLPQFKKDGIPVYRLTQAQIKEYKNSFFTEVIFNSDPVLPFNIKNLLSYLFIKKRNSITVISPGGVNYRLISIICKFRYSHKCVIIDEGIGAYLPQKDFEKIKTKSDSSRFKITNYLSAIKQNLSKLFINQIIDEKIFQNHGQLVPRTEVCDSLKTLYISSVSEKNTEKCIMLFKDFEVIEFEEIKILYKELLDMLSMTKLKIYVKKHPNDKDKNFDLLIARYSNAELINDLSSGEFLIAKYKPMCIIGGVSTVLFSAAAIFKTPTYSFMLLYKNYKGISKDRLRIIDWYYLKFNDSLKSFIFMLDLESLKYIVDREENE